MTQDEIEAIAQRPTIYSPFISRWIDGPADEAIDAAMAKEQA